MHGAAHTGTDVRHALPAQLHDLARLRAGRDRHGDRIAENRLHLELGTERGVGHRDLDGAVQLVLVAQEHLVRPFGDLDVQIAGRAAAETHLTLPGEADTHAVLDPGGDAHGHRAPRAVASVAAALVAGVGDDLADAVAGRALAHGHDLPEEGALHRLDLPGALADVAGDRLAVAVGSRAGTHVAEDRGVDGDLFGDTLGALGEIQGHVHQCRLTRLDTGLGSAARAEAPATAAEGTAVAEERLEDVAESPAAATETAEAARTGAGQRITAGVDDATLLRIGQHLVGGADLFELVFFARVDVGVQLPRLLAVGALELLITGALRHSQDCVVVTCHGCSDPSVSVGAWRRVLSRSRDARVDRPSPSSSRLGVASGRRRRCGVPDSDHGETAIIVRRAPRRCTWQRPPPRRWFPDSPSVWGRAHRRRRTRFPKHRTLSTRPRCHAGSRSGSPRRSAP